jgi:hypothetical protein
MFAVRARLSDYWNKIRSSICGAFDAFCAFPFSSNNTTCCDEPFDPF